MAVYDILNNGWTSIDSFPAGFSIDDFVTVLHGTNPKRRRLFAVNDKGWHLLEEAATDITGTIGNATTTPTAISAKLKSRGFNFGDIGGNDRRGQVGVDTKNGDQITIRVNH